MINRPVIPLAPDSVVYPESDGQPMGENDWHIQFIFLLFENLKALFRPRRHEVYVAGDLFWYPVEGDPHTVQAPDVMVVLGRPQHNRRCYKQWQEAGVAPAVVFEVKSPTDRSGDIDRKRRFCETHGVAEFYSFEVTEEPNQVEGWIRVGTHYEPIPRIAGWKSPALGIRFEFDQGKVSIRFPDGSPFLDTDQLRDRLQAEEERADFEAERAQIEAERAQAETERAQIEAERAQAETERAQAEAKRAQIEAERAQAEAERANRATARAAALERKLREAGLDPDAADGD
jgi:Uma2 family endonuclease